MSIEPMPSLLDVRQLIALYGILPLGKDSTFLRSRGALLAGAGSIFLAELFLLRILSEGRSVAHPRQHGGWGRGAQGALACAAMECCLTLFWAESPVSSHPER